MSPEITSGTHHGKVIPEIAAGLLAPRERIAASKIPPSKLDETIDVAVWNIREFGKGRRTEAAIHYIAEILGQFDLIAPVDLRDNLEDLIRRQNSATVSTVSNQRSISGSWR